MPGAGTGNAQSLVGLTAWPERLEVEIWAHHMNKEKQFRRPPPGESRGRACRSQNRSHTQHVCVTCSPFIIRPSLVHVCAGVMFEVHVMLAVAATQECANRPRGAVARARSVQLCGHCREAESHQDWVQLPWYAGNC
jgi:hypothetical protein